MFSNRQSASLSQLKRKGKKKKKKHPNLCNQQLHMISIFVWKSIAYDFLVCFIGANVSVSHKSSSSSEIRAVLDLIYIGFTRKVGLSKTKKQPTWEGPNTNSGPELCSSTSYILIIYMLFKKINYVFKQK